MNDKRYAVIRLDTLLFTLGGFAEPEPTARELRTARFKKLWLAGVPGREIAAELGMGAPNVYTRAYKLGLPRRLRIAPWATREAQNAIIADLWMAGHLSAQQIGRRVGLSAPTVWWRARQQMGLPARRGWRWHRRAA